MNILIYKPSRGKCLESEVGTNFLGGFYCVTLGKSLPISKLQFLHEKMGWGCVWFLALLSMLVCH